MPHSNNDSQAEAVHHKRELQRAGLEIQGCFVDFVA